MFRTNRLLSSPAFTITRNTRSRRSLRFFLPLSPSLCLFAPCYFLPSKSRIAADVRQSLIRRLSEREIDAKRALFRRVSSRLASREDPSPEPPRGGRLQRAINGFGSSRSPSTSPERKTIEVPAVSRLGSADIIAGRVSLTEFRVVFPVYNATKMA